MDNCINEGGGGKGLKKKNPFGLQTKKFRVCRIMPGKKWMGEGWFNYRNAQYILFM